MAWSAAWSTLFRPSRLFMAAAFLLLAAAAMDRYLGGSRPSMDFWLHDAYFSVSPAILCFLFGCYFLVFGGTYALFEERHARTANLVLGHIHFWLSFLPLVLMSYFFHLRAAAPAPDVDGHRSMQKYLILVVVSMLLFLVGQFAFLANLGWSFFQKPERAG